MATVWPFKQNWASPMVKTLEFRTEIITSWNGKEQRVAQRMSPRMTLRIRNTVKKDKRILFNRLMDIGMQDTFIVPDYSQNADTSGPFNYNTNFVNLTENPRWMTVPSMSFVRQIRFERPSGILNLTQNNWHPMSSQMQFSSNNLLETIPTGSRLYRAQEAYVALNQSSVRLTDEALEADLTFDVIPNNVEFNPIPAATRFHKDREVFLNKPDWISGVTVNFENRPVISDYDRGVTTRIHPIPFSNRISQFNFTNLDYGKYKDIEDLFMRCYGQQREFYVPTWENDMRLRFPIDQLSNAIRVKGTEIFDYYADSTIFRNIIIELANGEFLTFEIDSITDINDVDGHDTIINFVETFDSDIGLVDVVKVSWLVLSRFASDLLTSTWLTDTASQVQVAFRSLEDLPVDEVS